MNWIPSFIEIFNLPACHAAGWGFGVTFAVSILFVMTKGWHGVFTMDHANGVQKFHTEPTPRIGGIPIVMGLVVAWVKLPVDVQKLISPLLLAGMPAFIFGLGEDVTKRVGVTQRLVATMASGALAWWMTDYSLTRVDVWGADWLMKFTLVSVLFTAFAVGGVANAINIIDGFNGLACTAATLAFLAYAVIAYQVGDHNLASVCLVLAACVCGFFWVNWPLGKMFLGDGGAYFVGFALAWVAVLILARYEAVSAFAVLLVCVHPVVEVLFSIYRRRIKKLHPGSPDRLHFHSLVSQRFVRQRFAGWPNVWRNSLTGLLVGLMTLIAAVLACLTWKSILLSALGFVGLSLGYVALYARMVRFRWSSPIEFLMVKPSTVVAKG